MPIEDIKRIREKTGYKFSLSDCKNAYENSGRDVDAAIEYLKEREPEITLGLSAEGQGEFEKYTTKANRRANRLSRGWYTKNIIGIIIGIVIFALGITVFVLHINDEKPWLFLLGLLPTVIGLCTIISFIPRKRDNLSARERELKLCDISGQILALLFLVSLVAGIVFIFLVAFHVVNAKPLVGCGVTFVFSIVMLYIVTSRENYVKRMTDEEYTEDIARQQEEERRKAEEERAFKKNWRPIRNILLFWGAVDIVHNFFKELFKDPNDSRKG